jgi:hypothetical protein
VRSAERIDGVAAWLDALVALAERPDLRLPEPWFMWGRPR